MVGIDSKTTLTEIGAYLLEEGKLEFAEFIAMLIVKDQKKAEWVEPVRAKKVFRTCEGPEDNEEEHYSYSDEEGDSVPEEEYKVKVDTEGFQSLV